LFRSSFGAIHRIQSCGTVIAASHRHIPIWKLVVISLEISWHSVDQGCDAAAMLYRSIVQHAATVQICCATAASVPNGLFEAFACLMCFVKVRFV
jgi:hypothetical protein